MRTQLKRHSSYAYIFGGYSQKIILRQPLFSLQLFRQGGKAGAAGGMPGLPGIEVPRSYKSFLIVQAAFAALEAYLLQLQLLTDQSPAAGGAQPAAQL